jgi:hypothetical protein
MGKVMRTKRGEDAFEALAGFIEARGYRAITGRTPPLMDLIVWRRDRVEETAVELTDGTHAVPVAYMEEFVSRGWSHFATFGRASTGGWADRNGLHCVAESYDLDSESFAVSFLKHEARHFVDYVPYPSLESADLEYRAKLTELIYANQLLPELLAGFAGNAARVADAPHALASWHVVHDLSREILGSERPEDLAGLASVAADEVRTVARRLLAAHDEALRAAGAETTRGVLAH